MTKTENENEWFYLDPDNRIDPPKDTALYCCRCQKTRGTLTPVELHPDGMHVRKCGRFAANANAYLGIDCYNKVFTP